MAKTQINVKQLKSEAAKPFYAVAGATELAVAHARGYANEAQKNAQKRIKDVQDRVAKVERDPKALQGKLQDRAVTVVNARIDDLQSQARAAQTRFDARMKELQQDAKDFPNRVEAQLNEAIEELNETYADLAERGERFVAALRKDGVKAVAAVKSAPAKSSTRRSVIATEAAAKRSPGSSTKTSTKASTKSTAKKPAAKKPTAKKSTAKKSTAKKSTTTSTTTAKKSTTKKSTASASA